MLEKLINSSNYSFNPYSVPNIAIGTYCFLLGIFALIKNKRLQSIGLFALTSSTGIWLVGFGMMYASNNISTAFLWSKITYFLGGVCFITINGYFFMLTLTKKINCRKYRATLILGYLIMISFALLTIFTDLIVKFPPHRYFWGYYTNIGALHNVFLLLWLPYIFMSTYSVYRAYKKEQHPLEKNRLRIYFNGYLFGYLAVCDFLGAYKIEVYPFGYVFVATYLTLFTYNIIKYRALEIETVIHKTILWITSVLLLILPAGIAGFLIFRKFFVLLNPFISISLFSLMLASFAYYYFYFRPKIDNLFGKKELTQYEVLGRITKEISTTLDIKKFSLRLFSELGSSLNPQKIFIWFKDGRKELFFLYSRKDHNGVDFVSDHRLSFSLDDTIPEYLANSGKTLEMLSVPLNPKTQYLQQSPYFSIFKEEEIELLIPVLMENNMIGILGMGKKESLKLYLLKDIETLSLLGKEIGPLLYNAMHHKDVVEKERIDEELRLGKQIQRSLLPQAPPEAAGLIVCGCMEPAKEIAGDYYDFIGFPDKNKVAIIIGDVSGKGIAAGLVMSMVKASIYTLSQEGLSPKEILQRCNYFLNRTVGEEKSITLLYLLWESQTKTLTYCSAGHEHILIYRNQTQQLETIKSGGIMLSVIPEIDSYLEEKQIHLESKDKVMLYTDGATEARKEPGNMFGLERLKDSFEKHIREEAPQLLQSIKDDINSFISPHQQYDDITLIVLEIL